jgi:hypothetical protein
MVNIQSPYDGRDTKSRLNVEFVSTFQAALSPEGQTMVTSVTGNTEPAVRTVRGLVQVGITKSGPFFQTAGLKRVLSVYARQCSWCEAEGAEKEQRHTVRADVTSSRKQGPCV